MTQKFCKDCNKPIYRTSVRCKSCANKLQNNPAWKGGLDQETYADGWSHELRERIRFRDKFTCQLCGAKQNHKLRDKIGRFKLDVHHIDYNKNNNDSKNLVGLCHPCHIKTNYDREHYIEVFKELFIRRGIIRES